MSFFKPQVSFPLNFISPFSVMTHNSSEILYLKHYMFWTKRVHPSTIFIRFGFIQILHRCPVPWKKAALYFFSSNLLYFEQKWLGSKDFWMVGWKFTKFLISYLKPSQFFLTLYHSLVSWEITCLHFFCWNLRWFG